MPEYVYGVVKAGHRPDRQLGIGGAPVRALRSSGLGALVSELRDQEPRLSRDELLVHASVLEAALARGTVLPMRFGTVLEDADAVRKRLLDARADELKAALERLKDKVELRIRAVYEQEPLLREVIGRDREIARLRERLRGLSPDATYPEQIRLGELVAQAIERTRERDAQSMLKALSPVAAAVDVAPAPHERVALNASFLVDRERIAEFDAELEQVAGARAGRMRVKLTGPLPPHSFVELEEGV